MSNLKSKHKIYDYLILGGGPAGMQLSYYLQEANQDYLLLEGGDSVGEFFKRFPRHGMLISINKVNTGYTDPEINMRWDWNSLLTNDYGLLFKDYSKKFYPDSKDLVRYFKDFVKKYKLNVKTKQRATKISRDKSTNSFVITTDKSVFYCKKLIVATGISKPFIPDIKGIEHVTQYFDLDTDKTKLTNKRVLIIGKGNSAFETANHLIENASLIHIISPAPLKFAYNSRYPGHLRSINTEFMDTYLLKQQNGILNGTIKEIRKHDNGFLVTIAYSNAHEEVETIYYDEVISCTGFKFDSDIFADNCMPELCINDRFPKITTNYASTNIPELYFIGNITQSLDFKKKQSAFIHGFRYNAAFLARYLLAIYNKQSLVKEHISLSKKDITSHIVKLINQNSAMWQQTGYICCTYVFNPETHKIDFIPDVPTEYIKKARYTQNKYYLTVTLDFGDVIKNPDFDALRHNRVHKENYQQAYDSSVIHPIIKLYKGQSELTQHHIIEDFENEWLEDVHIKPLNEFITEIVEFIKTKQSSNIEKSS